MNDFLEHTGKLIELLHNEIYVLKIKLIDF